MKIEGKAGDISRAFHAASVAVPSRTPKPIVYSLLVEAHPPGCRITGSDLETTVSVELQDGVTGEGECLIPPKIVRAIAAMDDVDGITIEVNDGHVKLAGQRMKATAQTENSKEYPRLENIETAATFEIPGRLLCTGLARCLVAVGEDNARHALNSVFFHLGDVSRLASTNASRVASQEIPVTGINLDFQPLLPRQAATMVKSVFSNAETVEVGIGTSWMIFASKPSRVSCRLVSGRFPAHYADLIQCRDKGKATVNATMLSNVLRQIQPFTVTDDGRFPTVTCEVKDGKLLLSSANDSHAEIPIECDRDWEPITVQEVYLRDFLGTVDSDTFRWGLNNSMLVTETDDGLNCVFAGVKEI